MSCSRHDVAAVVISSRYQLDAILHNQSPRIKDRRHEAAVTCSAAPMQKHTAPIIMVYFRPSFWKNLGNKATTRAAQSQIFVTTLSLS